MRLCDHQHDRRAGYQHRVSERDKERALASAESRGLSLSGEQRDAFHHATDGKDLGVVIGYAGTGKSAMLGGLVTVLRWSPERLELATGDLRDDQVFRRV